MEEQNILPSYREILREIGAHLKTKKRLLFKRILLISWPGLVIAGLIFVMYFLGRRDIAALKMPYSDPWYTPFFIFCFIWFLFTVFYYCIMVWIFNVEKRVWIISHFDRMELNSRDSWKIAKKLSIPVLKFGTRIFIRYYLPITASVLALTIFFIVLLGLISPQTAESYLFLMIGIFCFLVILAAIYLYCLNIRLRFIWYIFLDLYRGQEVPVSRVLDINKNLIQLSKTDSFKKALAVNLGADSVRIITQGIINTIERGMADLGEAGRGIGLIFQVLGEESAKQVINFSKMLAIFVLYIQAYSAFYGKQREPNSFIYK